MSLSTLQKGLALRDNPLEDLVGRAFLCWVIDQCFRTLETWGDGVATGCSEGCAVIQSGLAGMSEMVWWHTTETVVSHWEAVGV